MKTVRFPLVNWKSMFVVFAESSLALQNDTTMKMQNVLILSTSKLWVCNWSINKNLLNNTASFISTWSWRLFLFSDANAQPAPERCRTKRVWEFPTSILQRKISICIDKCTACHNNASFLSAICNFQIGEKSHGKDEGWRKSSQPWSDFV